MGSARRKKASRVTARSRSGSGRLGAYLLTYLLSAALVTALIAYGYRLLRSHPTFAIDTLVIEGVSAETEADLRDQLSAMQSVNFFSVDLEEVRARVVAHPWVEQAGVRGTLPSTLTVIAREHRPAGLVRKGDRVWVIAADAREIADYARYSTPVDLPVIVGIDEAANPEEKIADGLEALRRIRMTSLFFWDQIETLDLSDEENMIVQLRSVQAPIYLGKEVITDNIRNYLSIASRLERDYPEPTYIELGFPDQVAILPKEVE